MRVTTSIIPSTVTKSKPKHMNKVLITYKTFKGRKLIMGIGLHVNSGLYVKSLTVKISIYNS